jgi:hypothetical protein
MQARYLRYPSRPLALAALTWGTPILVLAQAQGSPFMTGATALQTNILAWLTPIAIILVMVLGAMAMANRIVLIDDVVTKGRTLLAAAACLQRELPQADIRAFALIRTLGFVEQLEDVTKWCHGVIRWVGGDARREP